MNVWQKGKARYQGKKRKEREEAKRRAQESDDEDAAILEAADREEERKGQLVRPRKKWTVRKKEKWKDDILKKIVYDHDNPIMVSRDKLYAYLKEKRPDLVTRNRKSSGFKHKKFISRRYVDDWLRKQETFAQHRKWVKRKTVNHRLVMDKFNVIQVDLSDMKNSEVADDDLDDDEEEDDAGPANRRPYRYIFVAVDMHTKYVWARPLRTKHGSEVAGALRSVLQEMAPHKPKTIQSDNGSEFKSQFADTLKKAGIRQVFSLPYTPQSQGLVERTNGNIKRQISLYQTRFPGKQNWVQLLPKIVKAINNTYQSVIKMTPTQALKNENRQKVTENQVGSNKRLSKKNNMDKRKLFKGELVRIRVGAMGRGLMKNATKAWSQQIFKVIEVRTSKYGPGYHQTAYRLQGVPHPNDGRYFKNASAPLTEPTWWTNDQVTRYIPGTEGVPEGGPTLIVNKLIEPGVYFVKRNRQGRSPEYAGRYYPGYKVSFMGYDASYDSLEPAVDLRKFIWSEVEKFADRHEVQWRQRSLSQGNNAIADKMAIKDTDTVLPSRGFIEYRWRKKEGGRYTEWIDSRR